MTAISDKLIHEISFQPSTLENIDIAFQRWLNEDLNIFCTTKEGWQKVEIVWVGTERAFLSKKSKEAHEKTGALFFPLISVERKNITKNLDKKGKFYAGLPINSDEKGGTETITIAKRIKQDKTANFVNNEMKQRFGQSNFPRKSEKIVYETMSIPIPVYIEIDYEVKIKTLYQQQMNEMQQPFMTKTLGLNYFLIKNEGHRYECFMDANFNNLHSNAELDGKERVFESSLGVKVLGYLVGGDKNDNQPKIVVRENAVGFRMPKESVVFGDKTLEGKDYVGVSGIFAGPKKIRSV
jgi:hypothetical protein